jgi:hypothetical protein
MFFENVLTGDKDCVLLEVNAIDLANTAFGFAGEDDDFVAFLQTKLFLIFRLCSLSHVGYPFKR